MALMAGPGTSGSLSSQPALVPQARFPTWPLPDPANRANGTPGKDSPGRGKIAATWRAPRPQGQGRTTVIALQGVPAALLRCGFREEHRSTIRMLCWVQMVSARSSNATRSLWWLGTSVAMS